MALANLPHAPAFAAEAPLPAAATAVRDGLWAWLVTTPTGLAAVVGALATFFGALLGFLGGAVFNHWLARRRDDRLLDQRRYSAATALLSEIYVLMRETQTCRAEIRWHRREAIKKSLTATNATVNLAVLLPAALPTEQMLDRTLILSPPVTTAVIALCRLVGDFRTEMEPLLQRLSAARLAGEIHFFPTRALDDIDAKLEFLAENCRPVITTLTAEVAAIANRLGCEVPEPPTASGWITELPPDEERHPGDAETVPADPPAPA